MHHEDHCMCVNVDSPPLLLFSPRQCLLVLDVTVTHGALGSTWRRTRGLLDSDTAMRHVHAFQFQLVKVSACSGKYN